jgi:phage tail-like protein
MSRGTVTGLPVAQPIIDQLPSIYQDGPFLRSFTGGLDVVLAPAIAVLDCIDAYVDPALAPADFVRWLGGWVGTTLDEDWTLERRRRFVARAAELYAKRGTLAGLRDEIELYTGGRVHVDDPGRVATSTLPRADADRRTGDRTVRVTVDVADATAVNWPALQELVREAVPAHLPVEIELRETGEVVHEPVAPPPLAPRADRLPPPVPEAGDDARHTDADPGSEPS